MATDVKLIDKLLADYKKPEEIIGENGLLKRLTTALQESALERAPNRDHPTRPRDVVPTVFNLKPTPRPLRPVSEKGSDS